MNSAGEVSLLECTICSHLLHESSISVPCGHTFCDGCIKGWIASNSTCPTCRDPVKIVIPNFLARQFVEDSAKKIDEVAEDVKLSLSNNTVLSDREFLDQTCVKLNRMKQQDPKFTLSETTQQYEKKLEKYTLILQNGKQLTELSRGHLKIISTNLDRCLSVFSNRNHTIYVQCFNYVSGKSAYSKAVIQKVGEVVSLDFISQDVPFENSICEEEWIQDLTKPEACIVGCSLLVNMQECDFEEVKRVLVNITVPPLDHDDVPEKARWVGLSAIIGDVCKDIFANMDPCKSSLIVHSGLERFHNDRSLSGMAHFEFR